MALQIDMHNTLKTRTLPVVLILDMSGSMFGPRIESLYNAVKRMIENLNAAGGNEIDVEVAIVTFGRDVILHTPYTPVSVLNEKGISRFMPEGTTPLGEALRMTEFLIENKSLTPWNDYNPIVVLVSDGGPTDNWEQPMISFINGGKSSKCKRFAVALGEDVDCEVLQMFTENPTTDFYLVGESDIGECFSNIAVTALTQVMLESKG